MPDGQWSNFFDGTGDRLDAPNSPSFSGDFTVECWVYMTSVQNDRNFYLGNGNGGLSFGIFTSGNRLQAGANQIAYDVTSTNGIPVGAWTHVAVSRSGSTLRLFINGVNDGSVTQTRTYASQPVSIGGSPTTSINAYISNLRVVNGTAVYTSNFTPSTTPLTAITNTALLTCQTNRFRDNSSNNFAITRNGDVRVTPWSPFAPTSAYDPATNGGSGYFDGTGDSLTVPSNSAIDVSTVDFTFEFWAYPTARTNSVDAVFGHGNFTMMLYHNSANNWVLEVGNGSSNYFTISTSRDLNVWTHLAITRSGNTFTLWKNGVSAGTATNSGTIALSSRNLLVGLTNSGSNQFFTGYISNFRIVKGTAVYTSAFTPPTAPVTNITNTSLLLNFTNAGIFDTAGDNVIETVDNVQINTSVKKYGTGSLKFDGTGDYLKIPNTGLCNFGTGDFTVECWAYPSSSADLSILGDLGPTNAGIMFAFLSSTQLGWGRSHTAWDLITSGVTFSQNTWYHLAVSRSSGTLRIFVDGVQRASASNTQSYNMVNSFFAIGARQNTTNVFGPGQTFNGHIDDLRITLGQARYTSAFTPPTAELITYGTSDNIVNNSTYGVYQLA